jgi:CrcB protein
VKALLAVLAGGALGTGLRLALDLLVPHGDAGFPVSTLIINVVGAFALGLLTAHVWPRARPWVRAGLGPGLLGSFTTFSAFAVSLVSLAASGEWMPGALYLVATIVLGFGGAWAGLRLGARSARVEPSTRVSRAEPSTRVEPVDTPGVDT